MPTNCGPLKIAGPHAASPDAAAQHPLNKALLAVDLEV